MNSKDYVRLIDYFRNHYELEKRKNTDLQNTINSLELLIDVKTDIIVNLKRQLNTMKLKMQKIEESEMFINEFRIK